MNEPPRLPSTGSTVVVYVDGGHLVGTVGSYEHYNPKQYTFPVNFGSQCRTVSVDACTVLTRAPYSDGPRCLLASCDLHGAFFAEITANTTELPVPRRARGYGHAARIVDHAAAG